MSRFDPESYRRYRPHYPAEVFSGLLELLDTRGFHAPFDVVDLGCGAGHSAASLLRAGLPVRITGIDPDEAMLAEARLLPELANATFRKGTGDKTGLPSNSADAVIIGSALHWMAPEPTRDELLRILRARGLVLVFEYQFPKAIDRPSLNEWIRRGFNVDWRAPGQRPRGDFAQVTQALRSSPDLELIDDRKLPMEIELSPEELAGFLFSQSRYLHYEHSLGELRRASYRDEVQAKLVELMQGNPGRFDFRLTRALFALR